MKRMTKEKEPNIVDLIDEYNKLNTLKNEADKKCKVLGPKIKSYFKENDLCEFEGTNCIAKTSISQKNSFDEELLIKILKENGGSKAVKKIETVDHEMLENLIYNKKIDASVLAPAQRCVEQVSLRMYVKKEVADE